MQKKQVLFLSFLGCISYLIEGLIPSDPNVIQASGLVVGIIGGVTAIGGTIMSGIANQNAMDAAAQNQKMVSQQAQQALAFQVEQQKKLDAQKDKFFFQSLAGLPSANMLFKATEKMTSDANEQNMAEIEKIIKEIEDKADAPGTVLT